MLSRWSFCGGLAVCFLLAVGGRSTPPADKPAPGEPRPDLSAVAKRLWAISDVVLEKHVNPPTRQEMFLGAAQGLYSAAGLPAPADLSRRLSALTTEEQFAAFFEKVWKGADPDKVASAATLEDSLVAGLLRKVPGRAHVIAAEQLKGIDRVENNRYEGTGIQIRLNDQEKCAQIVVPFRNGPMHRAGAKPGDLIVEVDGQDMHDVKLSKVVSMLAGDKGTKVTVVVRQPGATETRTLKITRDVIPFTHVVGYRPGPEGTWEYRIASPAPVGYLHLEATSISALHELRQAERQLQAEGVRALVLDLRFNPGGTLQHTAQVADGLLDGGLLWRVRDRQGQVKEYRADRDCLFRDMPLVVLVNEYTGGGAVWLAAALQDNGRAILVGAPARSDGSVQSRIPLPGNTGALVLTTAVVERAKKSRAPIADEEDGGGQRPAGWSVEPDHVVTLTAKQRDGLAEWLHQKNLLDPPADAKPPDDPQLARAVELLESALKKTEQTDKPR
jgi:carboxyl-terminal processing protease